MLAERRIRQTERTMDNTRGQSMKKLKSIWADTDTILIGAGAGLSTSAGFSYTGERFQRYLSDLSRDTDFTTCIQVDFTRMRRWKNTGHSGAVISG